MDVVVRGLYLFRDCVHVDVVRFQLVILAHMHGRVLLLGLNSGSVHKIVVDEDGQQLPLVLVRGDQHNRIPHTNASRCQLVML